MSSSVCKPPASRTCEELPRHSDKLAPLGRKRVDPRRNRSGSRGSHCPAAHKLRPRANTDGCITGPAAGCEASVEKSVSRDTEGGATTECAALQDFALDPSVQTDGVGPAHEHPVALAGVAPPVCVSKAQKLPPPASPVLPPACPVEDPRATSASLDDGADTLKDKLSDYPCGFNPDVRRTLKLEYWDRTRECKERKWDHMDYIDATYPSREEWINKSVLAETETLLEPNMFPYNTPQGIEHWTLWSRRELEVPDVEEFVRHWIKTQRPEVVRWNLDENAERSINIYHVHVYFQVVPDDQVRPPPVDIDYGSRRDRLEDSDSFRGDDGGGDGEQGGEHGRRPQEEEPSSPSPKRTRRA